MGIVPAVDSDFELLERWRGGDATAAEHLLERHFAGLYRFFSAKMPEIAEDLVQITMMRCVEHRDRFEGRASFRTYLFTVARNVLFDRLRKVGRAPDRAQLSGISLVDLRTTPSAAVARNEDRAALVRALQALPLDVQITVELTYWEGLSAPEVAEITGVAASTVRSRLTRARQDLEALLLPAKKS